MEIYFLGKNETKTGSLRARQASEGEAKGKDERVKREKIGRFSLPRSFWLSSLSACHAG